MREYWILAATLTVILMSVLLFGALVRLSDRKQNAERKRSRRARDYGSLPSRLQKCGVDNKISPQAYRIMQIILFFTGFFLSLLYDVQVMVSLGIGIGMFFLPDMILKSMVKNENQKMLSDIEHIYNLLHLQSCAGAFFSDSLVDCYLVVTHKRLKDALITLVGEINGKHNIRTATDEFADKFDNPYLVTLAGIIRHGVEDGNTDAMLGDVIEQIKNIQNAQYIVEEGKQDMENLVVLTLVFAGIIVALLYLGAGTLQNSTNSLWM